ncbi:ribosome maturation factor RimP [Lunatibacter salilacus]|uniref:ribosome maturation factor RimP n=1 Tax=Lunatibacter salilacus TaxID=2483804 RepID=UPI00131E537C|nr:ribosome maturation factor RimP [Lunatibacter salilacus]
MDLEQTITEIVEKHLPDDSHFVVEVKLSRQGPKRALNILIDADNGVNIDGCAKVSRAVSDEVEAKNLIEEAYILEVSSPGVDYPLSSRRQYQKNIGRNLSVQLESGVTTEGLLKSVIQTGIVLAVTVKEKGKKATEEEVGVAFDQIKKSTVMVSFK